MKTAIEIAVLASLGTLAFGCAQTTSHTHVRHAVEAQRDALSACYADALEVDQDTDGLMQVALTVDEEGNVDDVSVDGGTLHDDEMPVCVSTALSSIEMRDPPSDETRIAYTLRFKPRD